MIAASYTMHLYCDCPTCVANSNKGRQSIGPKFGEFVGTNWTSTAKQARRAGWRINPDKTKAFAPGHEYQP